MVANNKIVQLIFSLFALLFAGLMIFISPDGILGFLNGWESSIIIFVSAIAGQFGITNFRDTYGIVKKWYESKTKAGVLLVVIPIVVVIIIPLFGIVLPGWVMKFLFALITGGGGLTLIGIFDALKQYKSNNYLKQ